MRGKKYSDEVKEQAYFLYATMRSYDDISKTLGIPKSTIKTWIKNKKPDEFDEVRTKKKKEFIENASEIIDIALERLKAELTDYDKPIPVNHLTTVIGTLYDKRALAKGESTENTKVTFDLPKGVEEYAD